jgi:hypothetical protein
MIKLVTYNSIEQSYSSKAKPNLAAEWLALLLKIREVPGTNLGPQTDYPD